MRALFVLASVLPALIRAEDAALVPSRCVAPALLEERADDGLGFWIFFKQNVEPSAAESSLAMKYGFVIHAHIRDHFRGKGFTVLSLTPNEVAGLRCERDVESVNRPGHLTPVP